MKFKFHSGEKVLCFEPDPTKARVLYDAKVPPRRDREEERVAGPRHGVRVRARMVARSGVSGGPRLSLPVTAGPARRLADGRERSRAPCWGVGAHALPLPAGARGRACAVENVAAAVSRACRRASVAHVTSSRSARPGGRSRMAR